MIIKLFKEHAVFIGILFLCAVLRFIPLLEYQLTLDELSGLNRTRFDGFADLMEKGVKIDAHPLLVQVLIFYTIKAFGYVTWIIKLPFILMSLGTVLYAYLLCIRNFSKQAGVFAALIFAFSMIFVFYAPIARMYCSGLFLSIALLYYFFEIFFRNNHRIFNYIFLGLFALLSAFNHHTNALFALTVCTSGFLFLNVQNRKKYLITCLVTVMCYLPNMSVTLYQLGIGGIGITQGGWLPVPETNTIVKLTKIILGTGKTYYVFILLVAAAVVLNRRLVIRKRQFFLLAIYLLNYVIIYVYSLYRASIYQHSVMLFASAAFVIFLASFLEYRNVKFFYGAAALVAGLLLFKTYIRKDYLHQSVKTVFEYQFERTLHYKKLYGNNNVYPVFFDADEFMQQIYFEKYGESFDCKISSDTVTHSTGMFAKFLAGLKCDYVVLSSAYPAQQALTAEYFPYLIENTQTQAINYKVYSRRPEDQVKVVDDDAELGFSNPINPGAFVYEKTDGLNKRNNGISLQVDSLNEFPFDAKTRYYKLNVVEGHAMLVKSRVKLFNLNPGLLSTCISVSNPKNREQINYDSKTVSDFVMAGDSSVTTYVDTFFGTNHSKTSGDAEVTAYLWNRSKDKFILKTFEIHIIDFCPRKWQLWD